MNIRYLEILEAVEQTGTFTGAAKKLQLTQSAVSHAIAELERQAGTALFDRLPRGVCLTHCGATLLEEAQGILTASRHLDRRIGHLEECTPIHIVSSITIASVLLPHILNRLKHTFPSLQITVRVTTARSAMEILKSGEADIAFWEGMEPQGAFRTILLETYKLRAACAPTFPLPKKAVSPRQLCTLPLLLREPGSSVRDTLDSTLSLAHQKAYPLWESVNTFALIKAAEAGLGITILPEILLADSLAHHNLRLVKLAGMEMENRMLAVLHENKHITHPLQIILDTLAALSLSK